jgi:hypothetical protein
VGRPVHHLIGANKKRIRDCETECPSCFEIDNEFELRGLLDRQVRWFCTFQDLAHVLGGVTIELAPIHPIRHWRLPQ